MNDNTGKNYMSPETKKKLLKSFAIRMVVALALFALALFLFIYFNK